MVMISLALSCTGRNLISTTRDVTIFMWIFDNIYFGSSKCSSLALVDVQGLQPYTDAFNQCRHFDFSFDVSRAKCTCVVLNLRDDLYDKKIDKDDNDTKRAICGVAALVIVAAEQKGDPVLVDKKMRGGGG
jgi:hypothetical protein